MEYRIEELARSGGVAVDTIRFYQGKGLLPSPRRQGRFTLYGTEHLERLRRIRQLQQRGFPLTVIRRFLDGDLEPSDEALVAAVTGPSVAPEQRLSLDELSQQSGVATPLLRELERAGLLVPVGTDAEPAYQASDLAAIRSGLALLEAGIPLADLMELGQQHAQAAERTARQAVALFDRHVRERLQAGGGGGDALGEALLDQFNRLLEAAGELVKHHFQRTLMVAAREHIEHRRD